MSAELEVLAPGMLTTVQDLGRSGLQHLGVPVSGAMDPFSHRLANALVGNARGAAALEVTLTGPTLRFHDARLVAVAGAWFELMLDEQPVPMATTFHVVPGATLRFGARRRGARAYIAVSGGVDVPPVFGSRATHLTTAMGGWQGRALARADRLPLGAAPPRSARAFPGGPDANARVVALGAVSEPWHVRVLAGPQDDLFVDGALESLTTNPYHVSVDADRVGFRLEGARLAHRAGADIISDATPAGSLQVPASGLPVLLMADRQTTGGYAKLATVISADLGVAAQAAPGDCLQFHLVDRAGALRALVAREQFLLAMEHDRA